MSLKQKTDLRTRSLDAGAHPQSGSETVPGRKDSRRLGLLFVVIGVLLIALAAGDALAGGGESDTLRGTGAGERLHGEAGSDELYGGDGEDYMVGGSGDDFIEAKNNGADNLDCGPGDDVANVDGGDRISPDCEKVFPG